MILLAIDLVGIFKHEIEFLIKVFFFLFIEFESKCVNNTELLKNSCVRVINAPNDKTFYLIIQPFIKCVKRSKLCFERVDHFLESNNISAYNFSSTSSDDIFGTNLIWKIVEIDKNSWRYTVFKISRKLYFFSKYLFDFCSSLLKLKEIRQCVLII
jgi:hypothetical protein